MQFSDKRNSLINTILKLKEIRLAGCPLMTVICPEVLRNWHPMHKHYTHQLPCQCHLSLSHVSFLKPVIPGPHQTSTTTSGSHGITNVHSKCYSQFSEPQWMSSVSLLVLSYPHLQCPVSQIQCPWSPPRPMIWYVITRLSKHLFLAPDYFHVPKCF